MNALTKMVAAASAVALIGFSQVALACGNQCDDNAGYYVDTSQWQYAEGVASGKYGVTAAETNGELENYGTKYFNRNAYAGSEALASNEHAGDLPSTAPTFTLTDQNVGFTGRHNSEWNVGQWQATSADGYGDVVATFSHSGGAIVQDGTDFNLSSFAQSGTFATSERQGNEPGVVSAIAGSDQSLGFSKKIPQHHK